MAETASGLQVPPVPCVGPAASVVAKDADATLVVSEYGKNITNTGAGAQISITLLPAANAAGLPLRLFQTVAQVTLIVPASGESIYLGGDGVADEWLSVPGVIGNYVDLYCDGEQYLVQDYSGAVVKAS
jgi:hypothetical protein